MFRVGVQIIQGRLKAEKAGPAFANIAESIVSELLAAAEIELARTAGHVLGGRFAVIAMGKLGGREMTASSDLDLIFVYDVPEHHTHSDSGQPMPVLVYYARLAQRLIAALTVLTSAGGLYEVDMRLRPTGNKGPVAVSLESFRRYHETEAWTWERLALTRARAIAGSPDLCSEVEAVIRVTLTAQADPTRLIADAREMRQKLAAQFPGKNRWDLKFAPGGLIDIEFVAQTLQLRDAPVRPRILSTSTIEALTRLRDSSALARKDADTIIEAGEFQQALTQVLRIAVDGTLDPQSVTPGLKALLLRAVEAPDFEVLQYRLAEMQKSAHAIFEDVLRS
jgi:glutamate-ammonia-ligase adenylyltransferase